MAEQRDIVQQLRARLRAAKLWPPVITDDEAQELKQIAEAANELERLRHRAEAAEARLEQAREAWDEMNSAISGISFDAARSKLLEALPASKSRLKREAVQREG